MNWIARLFVGIALSVAISLPALAGEGPYLRVGGGMSLGHDGLSDSVTVVVPPNTFRFDFRNEFDPGIAATAAVGYEFFFPRSIADVRLELEGSYRINDIVRIVGDVPTITLSDGYESEAIGGMVNGYLDLRSTLPIVPYVGAGAGLVHVSYEAPGGINYSDNAFAVQLMAGIYYRVIETLAIGVEYRFLKSDTLEFNNLGFTPSYEQQAVLLNLSLGF